MISKEVFAMQAQICQAMSNPTRLEIMHILRDGPCTVNFLAGLLMTSQATISRHLAVLRHNNLVIAQHQGKEQHYMLTNPKIGQVCDLMREVLTDQINHQAMAISLSEG
jgi:ArsR family transcriptional regulator